ncbi:hypothetical protein BS47DRAFT_1296563, partial [Hydnum rufescens UP504]
PRGEAKVYLSQSNDPYFNLAFEDWLFRSADVESPVLLFYRNSPSVIIGRNQNPWKEINFPALRRMGIPFVRRKSGGGTVYHDLGNTNYSIAFPRTSFDRRSNAELVARGVRALGPPAEVNERNDIVVDGLKICLNLFLYPPFGIHVSGSAYKIVNKRAYHHGTMLIDAGLGNLGDLLSNTKAPCTPKGIHSVRSPCWESSSLHARRLSRDFVNSVHQRIHRGIHIIDENELHREEIRKGHSELKSWDWSHGQTPEFTHDLKKTFPWAEVVLHIKSKHGVILSCDFQCKGRDGAKGVSEVCSQLGRDLVGRKYGILDLAEGTGIRREVIEWLRDDM